MSTISPIPQPRKQDVCSDVLSINAVDESGFLASVEITLTSGWRQVHGISDRAKLVEIGLYGRVRITLPDGSPDFKPSFFIPMNSDEMAVLQDPARHTFVNIYGNVVDLDGLRGGRA